MFVGSRLYELSKGYRGRTDFCIEYIPQIQPILDLMNYLHSRPTNAQYSEDLFPVKICSHDLYVKSTQYKKLVQMFVGSRLYKLSKGYRGQTDFLLKYIPQIQPILDLMNCLHSPPTKVNNFLNTYFHTIPM